MTLKEFIEQRMKELGLNTSAIINAGIGSMTLHRIKKGETVNIKDGTKQKLALILKCSIGDINQALSKREEPKTSVPAAEISPEIKSVLDDCMEKGPAKIPADKIKWHKDAPAMPDPEVVKELVLTVEQYKLQMKEMVLNQLYEATKDGITDMRMVYHAIGKQLLEELMK